jgi:hypothetical protein
MGAGGRTSYLTEQMSKEICDCIALGFTRKGTCAAVGIDESTFYMWRDKGKAALEKAGAKGNVPEKKRRYAEFELAVVKAEVAFKKLHLMNIKKHAIKSWQASAFLLERTFPEEYGRTKHDVEISGKDGGPIETEGKVMVYIPDNGRDKK